MKLVIFFSFLLLPLLSGAEASSPLIFIVNLENPITELSSSEIRDFYFKRRRQWPNGENLRFIDRNVGHSLRDLFLKTVLQKSNSEVELFWIGQKLYTGDSAPLRETSDSNTIQFVASFKGAIGYVSSNVQVGEKVKVVKVLAKGEE